jgi:Ni/Fe-hydrogenase subunit HybB-like protein
MKHGNRQLTRGRSILWILFLSALAVALVRLFTSLATVTNLNDETPWGLWKAWDVIIIVPLGASGFTLAFVRYFLKAEKYEFIMRRSVVWAAIAYLSMSIRLFFDIGLPWRLPYPIVFWGNIHSALFEVAWCVALYIIVLLFENLPRLMEQSGKAVLHRLERSLHVFLPLFVLAGILLSTMHQSSLGTLYMIVGERIDPLWYHPWLNYIFLLTAIAAGLSVAILIEAASNRLYRTEFQTHLLAKLGAAADVVLAIALIWRIEALMAEGTLRQIFVLRYETFLWWLEILAGYVIPILILSKRAWRNRRRGLVWASAATVFGVVLLRLNVVFTGMNADMKVHYFPSWTEWLFSIGFTAGTLVAWAWLAERLPGILGRSSISPGTPRADNQNTLSGEISANQDCLDLGR